MFRPLIHVWRSQEVYNILVVYLCPDAVELVLRFVRDSMLFDIKNQLYYYKLRSSPGLLTSNYPSLHSPFENRTPFVRCSRVTEFNIDKWFRVGDLRSLDPKGVNGVHYLRAYVQSGRFPKVHQVIQELNSRMGRYGCNIPVNLWNYFCHSNNSLRGETCGLTGGEEVIVHGFIFNMLGSDEFTNRFKRLTCANHHAFGLDQSIIDAMFLYYP